MIYSMTAFARHEIQAEWGCAVWEFVLLINVGNFFRLPEQFRALEIHCEKH